MTRLFQSLAILCGLGLGAGCASNQSAPLDQAPENGASLLQSGLQFAEVGDSLRAEQYLLAAHGAGVPWERVAVPLVGTCIRSGRLERALSYVKRARSRDPRDIHLMELSASLHLAVGDRVSAQQEVEALEQAAHLSTQISSFLAHYYLELGDDRIARRHLRMLVHETEPSDVTSWAHYELSRVERRLGLLEHSDSSVGSPLESEHTESAEAVSSGK